MLKNPFREIDQKNRKNSSDLLKKQFDFFKIVNQRANIVIACIAVCFLILGMRLTYIQIFENESYTMKLEAYTRKNQVVTPPRGEMYDRNGNLLVGNDDVLNITYYPPNYVDSYSEEKWQLAYDFAVEFDIGSEEASFREWQDYYLQVSEDYGNSLLSEQEMQDAIAKTSDTVSLESIIYPIKISRITQEMIDEIKEVPLTAEEREAGYLSNEQKYIAWPVMLKMEKATEQNSSIIVEDASTEDVSYLIEHKVDFPGFDVQADWKRTYPYGSTLRDVFGTVATNGLEEETMDYYLAKGYALNERFGSSGLEEQYENYLKGENTINEITYDEESGIAIMTPIQEGKKGYDLQLTIDIDLQQKVDQIIQDVLTEEEDNEYRKYFDEAFVILMDPNTGEILVMSGQQQLEDGEGFMPYASGNYLQNNMPGSIVKLATLYMGLNEGAVSPGEIILDAPICFKDTACKASATNKGLINDIEAIAQSSNVYMFHIAIRMAGGVYVPNAPLYLPLFEDTYDTYRKYYSMFGLGVPTQIDLPFEESGVAGTNDNEVSLLDYSIGQYESYTPLQLAQYVSTVATGRKVKPHFLKEVREVNSEESVVYQYGTQVISNLYGNEEYLDRVREGMIECVNTGFCGTRFRSMNKDIAAKTGTAELTNAYIRTNSSVVGFAPADNPTIAFVCVAPDSNNDRSQSNIAVTIMERVLEEYYKTYE